MGIFFPTPSADVVGVFDSQFRQVFINARPMKASVRENSRTMEHPLENGQVISDYRILLPIDIDLPMIVSAAFYRDTYAQIRQLFNSAELLQVQTRATNYGNMIIAEMPHEETPEFYDVLTINLHFRQVQIVQASSSFSPADPTEVSTQQRGEQNPTVLPGTASAATQGAFR